MVVVGDVWTDIDRLNQTAKERLGYPTQKPEALLERIINASSKEDDVVLDPFCGCGTTISVAERLHRRWIGIDITHLAISLIRNRLQETFTTSLSAYEVLGDPKDLSGAETLAKQNRYQFQWWALGLIKARPAQDKKKGADRGIDGYIYFFDEDNSTRKTIIVQVKSGHISPHDIRDLKGVLEREKAQIGAFITLEEPSQPMRVEAASAGFYQTAYLPNKPVPRIQILTIEELLHGKKLQYHQISAHTFRKAEKRGKALKPQKDILDGVEGFDID